VCRSDLFCLGAWENESTGEIISVPSGFASYGASVRLLHAERAVWFALSAAMELSGSVRAGVSAALPAPVSTGSLPCLHVRSLWLDLRPVRLGVGGPLQRSPNRPHRLGVWHL